MPKKPKRLPLKAEKIAVRLPGALLKRVDVIAAEALCPRSYAIRKLLLAGLKAAPFNRRWETR